MKSEYCTSFETQIINKTIEVKSCRGKLSYPINPSLTSLENCEKATEKAIKELYHCEPPEKCFKVSLKNGGWLFVTDLLYPYNIGQMINQMTPITES